MEQKIGRGTDAGLSGGCRRAAMAMSFAGAMVAAEGLGGVARAESGPKGGMQTPGTTIPSFEIGAGVDNKAEEARLRAVLGLRTQLAEGFVLSNSFGLHTKIDGTVGSEEMNTDLSIRLIGPLSLRAFGQNSRHLGILKYSVGGEIGFKLPVARLFAGTRYVLDQGQILPFGGASVDVVPNYLTILAICGHTVNTGATIGRLGVAVTLVQGMPAIVLDSFNTVKGGKLVFSDVTAGLRYTF